MSYIGYVPTHKCQTMGVMYRELPVIVSIIVPGKGVMVRGEVYLCVPFGCK